MSKKGKVIWFVTEGQTDEMFYKRIIEEVRANNEGRPFGVEKMKFYCAKGIGNLKKKIPSTFKRDIVQVYPDYEIVVFLCYDRDVFKLAQKPPIDRIDLQKHLKKLGASKVHHIKADPTIEAFFLHDIEGVKRYLKLKKRFQVNSGSSGLELLKKMFKEANRTYFKGERTEGLIEALDLTLVLSKICGQIKTLCRELGYTCDKTTCAKKAANQP